MDTSSVMRGLSEIRDESKIEQQSQEQAFLAWLRSNGAVFDSLSWPSPVPGSGIRGAVARSEIAMGEHMVTVPHRLMMSEFHAKADPDLGHVHRDNAKLLKGDNGLAQYLMQELLKGEASFYWPYLRVLPTPHNLRHWSEESLLELQDQKLLGRTALRAQQLRALYRDTTGVLSRIYPDLFPVNKYTFELFDFAWSTVQARAFGRRLKSSALVPFADCLNHGNVQTKYDFDVDGNGVFRLFPSGTNHYPRHVEVLNSYGRRANDNLLLEYGFAMLDNTWDTAEVVCSLSRHELLYDRKKACLRANRQHTLRLFHLRRNLWSVDVLRFYRCAVLTASELDKLEAEHDARSDPGRRQQPDIGPSAATGGGGGAGAGGGGGRGGGEGRSAGGGGEGGEGGGGREEGGGGGGAGRGAGGRAGGGGGGGKGQDGGVGEVGGGRAGGGREGGDCGCVPPSSEGTDRGDCRSSSSGTVPAASCSASPPAVSDESGSLSGRDRTAEGASAPERGGEDGARTSTNARVGFPGKASSADNELAALTEVVMQLLEARDAFPTTLEHDEAALQEVPAGAAPDLLSALTYRVTVKRILARQLEMAERAISFVQDIARKLELIADGGNVSSLREPETISAPPAPPALPAVANGNLSAVDCGLFPKSFFSYLSELENDLLLPEQPAKPHAGRDCSRGEICRGRRLSPHEPREM